MKLSYGEMVGVMEGMHWIAESGAGAFRARLRKLQFEGIPPGSNPGKGKRVDYTIPMLIEMAVALELIQSGLSPVEVANLLCVNREDLINACLFAGTNKDVREDPFALISPETLRIYSVNRTDDARLIGAISILRRTTLVQHFMKRTPFEPVTGEPWRWFVLDLREVLLNLMAHLVGETRTTDAIAHALAEVAVARSKDIERFRDERLDMISRLPTDDELDGNP